VLGGFLLVCFVSLVLCVFSSVVWAGATDLEAFLNKATEEATSSGLNIDQVPSSFTILDRHMIERSGAVTIAELLRFVPGLEVIREGNGSLHLIIRGNYSDRRVLILWDGQPLNVLLTRRALSFIGYLPADILERVEISRGPSSAVYGSYAVGGVINLVPRKWTKGGEAGAAYGAFDSARGFVSAGYEEGKTSVQFSAGASTTNGDRFRVLDAVRVPGHVDLHHDTDWQETRLRFGGLSVRFFRFHIIHTHYYEVTDRLLRRDDQENDHTFLGGRLGYDFHLSPETEGEVYVNWRQDILDYNTFYIFHPTSLEPLPLPPMDQPTLAREKARLREVTYGLRFTRKGDHHRLTLGSEFMENSVRSSQFSSNRLLCSPSDLRFCLIPLPEIERQHDPWPQVTERMWAVYFQDEWSLSEKDEINLGLRYDKYNGFSGEFSPRVVWIHRFSPRFVTKLIYGHGFRVPDLDALYDDHFPLVSGNPDLKPEKLDSVETVFIYKPTPRQRISLSLYRMWLRDVLGRRTPGGVGGWSYQQGGDEHVWGGEISFRHQGKMWDIYLFGGYQWGENEFDEPRPYVANVLAGGILSYACQCLPLEISLSWNYVGPRWREKYNLTREGTYVPDERPKLDGYTLVNLKMTYDLTERMSFWGAVINLFDDDIRYPSSYGGVQEDYRDQGRYWEIGFRVRF